MTSKNKPSILRKVINAVVKPFSNQELDPIAKAQLAMTIVFLRNSEIQEKFGFEPDNCGLKISEITSALKYLNINTECYTELIESYPKHFVILSFKRNKYIRLHEDFDESLIKKL